MAPSYFPPRDSGSSEVCPPRVERSAAGARPRFSGQHVGQLLAAGMSRAAAISGFERPAAARWATRRSLAVRLSVQVSSAQARAQRNSSAAWAVRTAAASAPRRLPARHSTSPRAALANAISTARPAAPRSSVAALLRIETACARSSARTRSRSGPSAPAAYSSLRSGSPVGRRTGLGSGAMAAFGRGQLRAYARDPGSRAVQVVCGPPAQARTGSG